MNGTYWEPAAIEWLRANAQGKTLGDLVKEFNAVAADQGWQPRVYHAIRQRVNRLPGVSTKRPQVAWQPEQLEWLQANRRDYASIPKLVAAYNDVAAQRGWTPRTEYAIAQQLSKRLKIVVKLSRPVVNLETGEVYQNATVAGRSVFVDPECIRSAIKNGNKSAGYHWAYVKEMEAAAKEEVSA